MNSLKPISEYILKMPQRQSESSQAVRYKSQSNWVNLDWNEYYQLVEKLGAGLSSIGVKKGDCVALMSNTRMEWAAMDLAILGIGAITVPVYHNNTAEDVQFILNNCEARVLVLENKIQQKVFEKIKDQCPLVEKVILIETADVNNDQITFFELKEMGERYLEKNIHFFKNACQTIQITDTATIIYTSGTTGQPKGVVITHTQIASEIIEGFGLFSLSPQDMTLTFLPFAHVLGRVEHWGQIYYGYTIAYAESIEKIKQNMEEMKPTIMFAVPRIFEKIYGAIWAQMETHPIRKKLFKWAIGIGKHVSHHRLTHQVIPIPLLAQYELAKKLVLSKIKAVFGGRLRFAISGGAPISLDVATFFHAAEVLILEGYGLTETTAAIAVNTPYNYQFGSVGQPIGDAKIKIAEDGEVLIQSHKVMKEYYKNPQATKDVMSNGWFHTGDIGEILSNGHLKITDRKKDLIKSAGGKYIAPQRLEGLLKTHPIISQVLIHGDQKKYIVALITVDRAYIEKLAKDHRITYKNWKDLAQESLIKEYVRKAVADTNTHLASFETIKKYSILPVEFSVEGGELTPSLKVKRKLLDQKYKKELEELY